MVEAVFKEKFLNPERYKFEQTRLESRQHVGHVLQNDPPQQIAGKDGSMHQFVSHRVSHSKPIEFSATGINITRQSLTFITKVIVHVYSDEMDYCCHQGHTVYFGFMFIRATFLLARLSSAQPTSRSSVAA
ncbi:hypothetical protein INT44_004717 [Umbelopsis vinacea]|uniref:Uncharacterized protein n=1 Tax=Umbelopsis vinacea TaxID=44442 RepID=A0A8H7PFG9_9FUNG|nr:hypothetical protein INT44_004717 [Umbelopsis vinacea]